MEVCLGIQPNGKLFYTTLENARNFVICGYSGCGKTELAYNLIEQLNNAKIYILNPLNIYYKQFIGRKDIFIANNISTAKQYLDNITDEIHNRISTYNKSKQKIVVVVDAYETYNLEWSFNILPYLKDILSGKKFGVHFIMTTQYTRQPQQFKNILLNSSIICMSGAYRKLYLNSEPKHLSNNCNILAQIIGENELIELVPNYFPLLSKIQNNN